MVLGGRVNKSLVSLIQQAGGQAVGLSGKDGNLLKARQARYISPLLLSSFCFNPNASVFSLPKLLALTCAPPPLIVTDDREGHWLCR